RRFFLVGEWSHRPGARGAGRSNAIGTATGAIRSRPAPGSLPAARRFIVRPDSATFRLRRRLEREPDAIACRRSQDRSAMKRTLIKNATVLTVDPDLGDMPGADILIEGNAIAEVERNPAAGDAAVIDGSHWIVIPGLVNAHIHTWEFQLRGIGSDWVGSRDYHANMHRGMATHYTARDVYVGNLLGALNQIHHGATTIFDWCHILRDAEMTDAAIEGLEASGIRAVFGRGTNKPPERPGETPFYKIPFPREEIHRLRTGRLASDDRLVTL